MSIRVRKPGLLTTVQDRGRHGFAGLGIGSAGAMDDVAMRLANALVGNEDHCAALEMTLLGPLLQFERAATIALCGAEVDARLGNAVLPMWSRVEVAAGSTIDCMHMRRGARAYLAVAGGFVTPRVLGSAASDLHGGIGRPALVAGDELVIDDRAQQSITRSRSWQLDPGPWFDASATRPLHLIAATHSGLLDERSRALLHTTEFHVANDSNRVGCRLDGERLALAHAVETISEPVARGTVQLPPGGQPIVLMAEHPTTGGYPRIGQVAASDVHLLAQRRPGDRVRFAAITLDDAQSRYLEHERALGTLIRAIHERLHA